MKKNVLAVYFTQTGQLENIVNSFCQAFTNHESIELEKLRIYPGSDYEFPWSGKKFFAAMPDSVLLRPQTLKDFELRYDHYDLVIFAYQPWFLSPSIPATSILKHEKIKGILRDTPVVTLIGARNMWLNSQEKIKGMLNEAGANLIGNVALIDRNNNLASGVSIVYWLIYGKKERYLGIFPKPGVSDADIESSKLFGEMVLEHLLENKENELQQKLVDSGAVTVRDNIMFIEGKAGRLFSIWASFISKRKNKEAWLVVFKYYLFIALFIVSPIVLLVNNIFVRPFTGKSRKRKKKYYLGLNR